MNLLCLIQNVREIVNGSTPPNVLTEDDSAIALDDSTWSLNNTPKGTPNDSKADLSLDKTDELYSYQSDDYPSDDVILLERLCRMGYFKGGHHLEEIMYLENIRRSQLLQILDKFRDVLITCESEDPAMALFYSQATSR